ncbi:winged helix-turn-helix domain-containing protein [Pseudoalteromonas phenolica]|uniref:OmpR/PhoB-type domain-containing protein n=1 Tax=Pseudoalteromonas phenolica TaxID=161398 RepID=A0A0S2JY16_9GAMM|nr:winged helix-turn-helix domain-containing protein [Pseudoalteromonas phenolica]ALO40691.1 hypothetical protein PP2015_163 [Pseudoalteromonas phenolica]
MARYKIGAWICDFATQSITDGAQKRELDPLSFKLLEYFILNNERIITRQELIEQVWQKGFVDDNAINRAISELRKTLKSELEPGLSIKTHYRKGYSLFLPVEALSCTTEQTRTALKPTKPSITDKEVGKSSNNRLYFSAGAVFFATIMAIIFLFPKESEKEVLTTSNTQSIQLTPTPLSWYQGGHNNLYLSPDQHTLAYQLYTEREELSTTEIYLFDFATQTHKRINLPYSEVSLKGWSADNQKIFFSIFKPVPNSEATQQTTCGVWSITNFHSDSPHISELLSCDKFTNLPRLGNIFSLTPNNIIHEKSMQNENGYTNALFKHNLRDNSSFRITTPSSIGQGDYIVAITTKPQRIIFERETTSGYQLFMIGENGHNLEKIADLSERIWSASFNEKTGILSWFTRGAQLMHQFDIKGKELLGTISMPMPLKQYTIPIGSKTLLTSTYPYHHDSLEYNMTSKRFTHFARPGVYESTTHYIGSNTHIAAVAGVNAKDYKLVKIKDGNYHPIKTAEEVDWPYDSDTESNTVFARSLHSGKYFLLNTPELSVEKEIALNYRVLSARLKNNLIAAIVSDQELGQRKVLVHNTKLSTTLEVDIAQPISIDWLNNDTLIVLDKQHTIHFLDLNTEHKGESLSLKEINTEFNSAEKVYLASSENGIFLTIDDGKVFKLKLNGHPSLEFMLDISKELKSNVYVSKFNIQNDRLLFSVLNNKYNEIILYSSS